MLAEVRSESWQDHAWPESVARVFHTRPWATVLATIIGFALIFLLMRFAGSQTGEGFYAVMSHSLMGAIFVPAFVLPLLALVVGLRQYWQTVGGVRVRWAHIRDAVRQASQMKNLQGGHGDGCNFEQEERFSHNRRMAHHAIFYGFLLCFASTSAGTVLHYVFDRPAPYDLLSLPKVFGVSGGLMLTVGCFWMLRLKAHADPNLSDRGTAAADAAFVWLLGFVGLSGLVLCVFGSTFALPVLLAVHLGAVFSFFLMTPYSKMAHGFYRFAALIRDAQARDVG